MTSTLTRRRLPTLCPQAYIGSQPRVVGCGAARCSNWDKRTSACTVETGAEHFPVVPVHERPDCPIASRCQHHHQAASGTCVVRERGMVCESALVYAGMSEADASDHPQGFNAITAATEEDLAYRATRLSP